MRISKTVVTACWTLVLMLGGPAAAEEDALFRDDAVLDVERLAGAVLERNPGLAGMRAAVAAAAARIEPAESFDDPMLSLSAAPNTFGSDVGGRGSIQFSQSLPWWGTRDARTAAARAGTDAALQDVETLRRRLQAVAVTAFAEWRFLHVALDVNARHRESLDEIREIARARYVSGRASQQDVLQAEVERALLRQQALELERRKSAVHARINALLNRPVDASLPPPREPALSPVMPAYPEASVIDGHPGVRALEFRRQAARADVRVAEKARFPRFNVMAGYNGVMDPSEKRLMVGASINVPLDQGRRRAEIDGARARELGLGHALQDRRAQLAGELFVARAAVEQTRQSLALYRDELIPLAEHVLAVATAEYSAGTGDFLKVVAAERYRLDTALGEARTEAELLQHVAELGRLTGTAYLSEVNSNER